MLRTQARVRPRTRAERIFGRDPVDADARTLFAGADGERAVASALAQLPDGWTVLHSLPVGRSGADIDHLVVGPAGIFTIDTKYYIDASVWVAGRTVVIAGRKQSNIARAEADARRVDRLLADAALDDASSRHGVPDDAATSSDAVPCGSAGACPAVRPIIAVVGARRLRVRDDPRTVTVLRAESLRRYLLRQPARLTGGEVQHCVALLSRPEAWQPSAEAGPELLIRFGALDREVRRARRIRAGWALVLLALPVVALATAVAAAVSLLPS